MAVALIWFYFLAVGHHRNLDGIGVDHCSFMMVTALARCDERDADRCQMAWTIWFGRTIKISALREGERIDTVD